MLCARSGIRLVRHIIFLGRHCGGNALCRHERALAVASIGHVLAVPMTDASIPFSFPSV
jgi:hypothetical protein